MAYLGRKGQTAPLASADLPTNSISTNHLIANSVTSAKIGVDVIVAEDIANNAITVAEIADDAVTGAKLANDIAITTTGALTGTTGDFNWDSNTLVVDSSASAVGIGTATPAGAQLDINGGAGGNTAHNLILRVDTGWNSTIRFVENNAVRAGIEYDGGANGLRFQCSDTSSAPVADPTTRMFITDAGQVLIGKTAYSSSGAGLYLMKDTNNGGRIAFTRVDNSNTQYNMSFYTSGGTKVGEVTTTTSATSYVESSDYRLKENVVAMSGSINRLKALKPSRFNFIVDANTTVDGFLAHEAQAVVPESVVGEKDAVDENGEIDPQGIDKSKLVPLLVGALQEAITRIETLENA